MSLQPRDSFVLDPREIARLTRETAKVLARLQQGPVTRRELNALTINPTARVSDIRAAGYAVLCDEKPSGASVYRLQGAPVTVGHDINTAQEGSLF